MPKLSTAGDVWAETDTPLHHAVARGDAVRVAALLRQGANPNARDVSGLTPLHLTCLHNSTEIARLLLAAGALPDALDHDDRSPLHRAAVWDRTELASLLLDAKAVCDVPDLDDHCPLELACQSGSTGVVAVLLESGGAQHLDQNKLAFRMASYGEVAILRLLIASNANPLSVKAKTRDTLLIAAAREGNDDVVEFLLKNYPGETSPCLLNWQNLQGKSALIAACENGNDEIALALINAGANATLVDNTNCNALFYAASECSQRVVAALSVAGPAFRNESNQHHRFRKSKLSSSVRTSSLPLIPAPLHGDASAAAEPTSTPGTGRPRALSQRLNEKESPLLTRRLN